MATLSNESKIAELLSGHVGNLLGGVIVPLASGKASPDTSVLNSGTNTIRLVRVVVPYTGRLRDFTVFIGTSSGNLMGGVYDTGDASSGNRTLLWSSGSVAAGAGNAWQVLGDPNIPVSAGQHLDLAIIADNVTVTLGRMSQPIANGAVQLPANFLPVPGGALPKLAASFSPGSFILPATMDEPSIALVSSVYALIAHL